MNSQKPTKKSPSLASDIIGKLIVISFVCVIINLWFIPQIIFTLLFGWAFFICRNLFDINIDIVLILEIIITILLLTFGFQWFISWLYKNYYDPIEVTEGRLKPRSHQRWIIIGFAILYLTGTISITGIIHEMTLFVQPPIVTEYYDSTRRRIDHVGEDIKNVYQRDDQQVLHPLPIVAQPIPIKKLLEPKELVKTLKKPEELKRFIQSIDYISNIDEWGMPIMYSSNGENSYILRSYGPNRILGGGAGEFDDLVYSDGKFLTD